MKRTSSILLSLVMLLGITGCKKNPAPAPAPTDNTGEVLPVVYVLTGETAYRADGTPGHYKTVYSYDDTGHLLSQTTDQGTLESVWDDELGVYITQSLPYDGTIDYTVRYTYDHQGNLINLVSNQPNFTTDFSSQKVHYAYGENGIPQSLFYTVSNDEERNYRIAHNEQGLLTCVDSPLPTRTESVCEFEYDATNRLTLVCYHHLEAIHQVLYHYDTDDRLISMQSFITHATLPHHSDRLNFSLEKTTDFTYDKSGRLTGRKNFDSDGLLTDSVVISYLPDGKTDSICYFGLDGNLLDGFSFRYTGGQTACVWSHSGDNEQPRIVELLYDEQGNLIRRTEESGDYVEYSYKPLHVTEQEEIQFHRAAFLRNKTDLDGYSTNLAFDYRPLSGFFLEIPYPISPLQETDVLRN